MVVNNTFSSTNFNNHRNKIEKRTPNMDPTIFPYYGQDFT